MIISTAEIRNHLWSDTFYDLMFLFLDFVDTFLICVDIFQFYRHVLKMCWLRWNGKII